MPHRHNGKADRNGKHHDKGQWGLCMTCKWWQIEPGARTLPSTAGYCIEESLQPFQLRVTGNSGCNKYMQGAPAHGKGSSAKPPTAKPMR